MSHKDRNYVKGKTFGYLTVIDNNYIKHGKQNVLVKCICGKIKYVNLSNIVYPNRTSSCGCMKGKLISNHTTKHGLHKTHGIYNIFRAMKYRCNNKKCKDYSRYGGRGIKVLRNDFVSFYNDMNESYIEHVKKYGEKNTSIDRIDVNGNYCKENCRRVTQKGQCNNRRNNLIIEYKGNKYTLQQLSELTGVNRHTISKHYKNGECIEDIINKYKKIGDEGRINIEQNKIWNPGDRKGYVLYDYV